MPLYEYSCSECGEEFDQLVRFSEADQAQEMFIKCKVEADEQHNLHLDYIRQVHDFDKIISGMRSKQRKEKKSKRKEQEQEEAESIFDRFKTGDKLSTDDFMVLQKAGYL